MLTADQHLVGLILRHASDDALLMELRKQQCYNLEEVAFSVQIPSSFVSVPIFQVPSFILPFHDMPCASMKQFATPLACDSFKRIKP